MLSAKEVYYAVKKNNHEFLRKNQDKIDLDICGGDWDFEHLPVLGLCSYLDNVECLQILIERYINYRTNKGYRGVLSALEIAIQHDYIDCLNVIIKSGLVNIKDCDFDDLPICIAVKYKSLECLKILIANGVDLEVKNIVGATPLMYAAKRKFVDCVRILIEAGADINYCTGIGINHTVLYCSAVNNWDNCGCQNVLLKAGAKIVGRDYLEPSFENIRLFANKQSEVWYPELTEYYPDKFVEIVETMLIWWSRECVLPLELIFVICSWIAVNNNNLCEDTFGCKISGRKYEEDVSEVSDHDMGVDFVFD